MNIKVNDINIYYEVYGDGTPIILLHGNSEKSKDISYELMANY